MKPYHYFLGLCVLLLGILPCSISSDLLSQTRYTVTGRVVDSETGEGITGVKVIIYELGEGCYTDENGEYSLDLPKGPYNMFFSMYGYQYERYTLDVPQNCEVNMEMGNVETGSRNIVISQEGEEPVIDDTPNVIKFVERLGEIFLVEMWRM